MNMTDTRQFVNGIQHQNMQLLGEVVSWSLPENTVVPFVTLQQALDNAGLDKDVAREMRNRHAFARAAKQLATERIIRCVEDKPHMMRFQFTKEHREAHKFDYKLETILDLDKDTGKITSEDGNSITLVNEAQRLLEKAKNERNTADISRYIMSLFDKEADLFPVRAAGGVYFVPEHHIGFVDRIQKFLELINGSITRFPVPAGTVQGNKSVKDAVQQGLQALIEEHLKAVEEFGTDTRESTMAKAGAKIEQTRFKIEAYAEYLEDQREKLAASLAAVNLTFKQKVIQVLEAKKEAKSNA